MSYAGQSTLLKTIRIPNNIMHLSSRLPKKNYDNSLDGANLSSERKGSNFKNQYHNTMGKKKINDPDPPALASINDSLLQDNQSSVNPLQNVESLGDINTPDSILKLPHIKNHSPAAASNSTNDQSKLPVSNSSVVQDRHIIL
mmetsp:Transcript_35735/g.54690  ORF Transcript_35735/g.54690 Transcript_35735/m.54690 type:complete len:143 (+) Transcript_35735:863-1291(+)